MRFKINTESTDQVITINFPLFGSIAQQSPRKDREYHHFPQVYNRTLSGNLIVEKSLNN